MRNESCRYCALAACVCNEQGLAVGSVLKIPPPPSYSVQQQQQQQRTSGMSAPAAFAFAFVSFALSFVSSSPLPRAVEIG